MISDSSQVCREERFIERKMCYPYCVAQWSIGLSFKPKNIYINLQKNQANNLNVDHRQNFLTNHGRNSGRRS